MHCDVLGDGPPLVLLHGVGFGPESFAAVARCCASRHRVIVPHRPGYGAGVAAAIPGGLDVQVDRIAAAVAARVDGTVLVAGVSGGATLAIALAVRAPWLVRGLVVHEPALGPLAPGLDGVLRAAAAAFDDALSPVEPARALARRLAGDTVWAGLSDAPELIAARAPVMAREVAHFAGFAPSRDDLAGLRSLPLISSLGRDSGPERAEVSRILVGDAGAVEAVLPGGHLIQIEAPEAFAALSESELFA